MAETFTGRERRQKLTCPQALTAQKWCSSLSFLVVVRALFAGGGLLDANEVDAAVDRRQCAAVGVLVIEEWIEREVAQVCAC